ncbi:protein translocase subunit SecA2, chloroplastic isoform X1 [Tanacetum coccineum]
MPTEMELTLEQTQQGVSYEVSVLSDIEDSHGPSDAMHKPLPATQSQKDFVSKLTEIHSFLLTLSLRNIRVNSFTMKMEILLEPTSNKLMVDPHGSEGYLKMVVEVPDSSWLTRSIATCSYPTDKHKDIMKAQNGMSMSVQKSQVHKMAKFQDGVKRLCLVDDLKMLKITMSNTSSRNKLNPKVNDHYNIFSRESQKDELKTKRQSIICAKIYNETDLKKSKADNLEQLVGVTKPLVVDVNNPSVGMPKGYLSANCPYFQEGCDAVGKAGISALVKCTFAIRQLAYVAVPDSLDEYLQIGEKTSRDCCCISVRGDYRSYMARSICEGLRKLTSKNSTLFMRTNMGFLFSNNVVNVFLRQSRFFNDLKVGKDGGSNDVKRIRYKQAHEAARKDVERAFGVLKKKWTIVKTPARSRSHKRITHLMYTCIILHNMIRKEKGKAISPDFYPEEQHREDDPVRSAQDRLRV